MAIVATPTAQASAAYVTELLAALFPGQTRGAAGAYTGGQVDKATLSSLATTMLASYIADYIATLPAIIYDSAGA